MTAYDRLRLIALAPVLLFVGAAANVPASAAERAKIVAGDARVIDGRTLVVRQQAFRLVGIDVPDLGQTCERFGKAYPCGNVARTALMDLVAGTRVRCIPVKAASGKISAGADISFARCTATGIDLSWNMVHTGWAVPSDAGKALYGRVAARARKRKAGLWRGSFVPPGVWRAALADKRSGRTKEQCFRGQLMGGSADCRTLRVGNGLSLVLAGPGVAAKPGGAVCACGTYFRQMTTACGTKPTLIPYKVGHEADCPR